MSVNAAKSDPTAFLAANLANGKSSSHIDGMASAFAEKLATMLASMPENLRGDITINSGYRDIQRQQQLWIDALKKYGSPEAARKWVAPPGNSQHNKGNAADLGYASDAARKWAHENAGNFGLSFPLANENWHIEDTDARNKAKSAELDRQTEVITRQNDARRNLNQSVQEGLDLARFEQSISGMSVAQQRIELDVYRAQQEAKRAGITLSEEELQKLREKIALTQQIDGENKKASDSAEGLKNAQKFFAESFTNSLSGLLTGTQDLNGAVRSLINSLIDATLQAALLGKGPLAGLAGVGSGIFGAIFGFADGGYTGDGGKYEPAGVVHKGEYVMSKKATSRIGVGNLEALHRGALGGYADGGFVTDAPPIRKPDLRAANTNTAPVQNITISAPVTVNANGGDPAQNADLAKQVGRQMEQQMRG
ncbi:MAG: D-alanyl-D-alanine carboxypeptidase family protein, partial [Rhizobium oryzihabitans]